MRLANAILCKKFIRDCHQASSFVAPAILWAIIRVSVGTYATLSFGDNFHIKPARVTGYTASRESVK